MKSVIIGVFAHPDDEAFGPSGYLITSVSSGSDVHLICATDGSAGQSRADTRHQELHDSANIIGASSTSMLDFSDGNLSNNNYQKLVADIKEVVLKIADSYEVKINLSFVTYEQNGISGHLDHIAVSYATTFIYTHHEKWLPENVTLGKLRYFCVCDAQKPEDLDYFVYSPKGHPEEQIDETIDVGSVLDIKKQCILAHKSQDDAKNMLTKDDKLLKHEHFLLYKH